MKAERFLCCLLYTFFNHKTEVKVNGCCPLLPCSIFCCCRSWRTSGMLRTRQGNRVTVQSPTLLLLSSSEQSGQPTRDLWKGAQIIVANCRSYHRHDIHFADVAQSHQSSCHDEAHVPFTSSNECYWQLCEGIREVKRAMHDCMSGMELHVWQYL